VPDPWFNEPAYEVQRGTERGAALSKSYNETIRNHTVSKAIESHLSAILSKTNQYIEFESIMIKHFLEKRSLIQKELWSWVRDDHKLAPIVGRVCFLFEQLSDQARGTTRSKRNRVARKNEPIELDEEEDTEYVPLKSNKTIEVDLSDEEENRENTKTAGGGVNLVDLT
jgi:hypothetical protein